MCWRFQPAKLAYVFRCSGLNCKNEATVPLLEGEKNLLSKDAEASVIRRVGALGWYVQSYKPRAILCPTCSISVKPPVQKNLMEMGNWEKVVESAVGETYTLKVPGGKLYLHQFNYELHNGVLGFAQSMEFVREVE